MRVYDANNPLLVSAEILLGSRQAADELGIDIAAQLRSCDIDSDLLVHPRGFITYHQVVEFLELVAQQHASPLFGFYVARHQPPAQFGLMTQLVTLCETLGEGLEKALKYSRIYSEESQWEIERDRGYAFLKRRHRLIYPGRQVQMHLLAVTLMIKASKLLMDNVGELASVSFAHGKPEGADVLNRFFNAPVYFEQSYDGYAFSEALLNRPMGTSDPVLLDIVESHMQRLLDEDPIGQELELRVQHLIRKNLGSRNCNIEGVAQLLGMHARSLQRALKQRGLSFRDLLTEVRQMVAEDYLTNSNISLGDLSDILGYQNVSAFSRAFKNVTGKAPDHWKQSTLDDKR